MDFMKFLSGDTEVVKHIDTPGDYVFVSDMIQNEGFHIQPEFIRFQHVFDQGSTGAKVWVQAPCDGEFYVALQIQDTFGTFDEEFVPVPDTECGPFIERLVELSVGGKPLGTFRFGGDDRKYYNFVTKQPVMLRKGDEICYRVLEGEKALFTAIMLMQQRPKEQTNAILNVSTDNGEVRFWTKVASRVQLIFGDKVYTESQYLNNHKFQIPEEFWGIRFAIEACDEQGNIVRGRGTCRGKVAEKRENGSIWMALGSCRVENLDSTFEVPVQSVLPVKQGVLFDTDNIQIYDDSGKSYPTDCVVTSRWQDESLRTVALSALLPMDERKFHVSNNSEEKKQTDELQKLFVKQESDGFTVVNGEKMWHFCNDSDAILPDREIYAVLYDENGERFVATGGCYQVTYEGLNHVTVSRINHFERNGKKHLKCLTHLHFYRGIDAYSLEFGFENDLMEREFTVLTGIYLEEKGCFGKDMDLLQLDQDIVIENGERITKRHDGWFENEEESLFVQDFWQNYPKSVSVSNEIRKIGICPFITQPEHYRNENIRLESRWFFYLKTGKYEFHCGLQKFHTIVWGKEARRLSDIIYLAPDKYVLEESAAFGHLKCDCPDFKEYDQMMLEGFEMYENHRESYLEYGMLNYGDSFGERDIHWTNQEYDFPYGLLIHFLRTGDQRFYQIGRRAAAHYAEVDCSHRNVHYEENGWFFIHTVGHANNYYPPFLLPGCFEFIKSHVGHIFSQGMAEYYKMTGIERYKQVLIDCADSLAKYYTAKYDFLTEREPGWSMLTLEAAYELTLDPYYLNACRIIMERVYQKQDPATGCLKYFGYEVTPECTEEERSDTVCYGGKAFMHGIVGSAAKYFYHLTGDVRARDAAIRIARWLAEEMFDETIDGFWYTEGYKKGNRREDEPEVNIEILDVILFACLETGNKEYLRIAKRAFQKTLDATYRKDFNVSKIFAMRLRFAPEIMYYYRKAQQLLLEEK